jgi:hypothetical protein
MMNRATGRAADANPSGGRSHRLPRWAWFNAAAFALGLLPVVLALTVHNHGSTADPDCVRRCYTLVHTAGPGVLGYLGAPALISLVLPVLLHLKSTRRSHFADHAAWSLAILSCLLGFVALLTGGLAVLPAVVLTVCAVVAAPLAPEPPPFTSIAHPVPERARR